MAVRTLESHVTDLLSRKVAEVKTSGTPNPDVETAALYESIALNLLLRPRSVLYVALLAKNGLLKAVTDELTALDALRQTVQDLANTSYSVVDGKSLQGARQALIQLEGLDKVSQDSGPYQRFSKSVQDFLSDQLGKTVRKPGATELSRSDVEAAADLPTDYQELKTAHEDVLDRLFALSVGVENFVSSPIGTMLGLTTAYRARQDIEDILDLISDGTASSQARDIAMRLLGDRASLKTMSSVPSYTDPVLDTTQQLPAGYALSAQSDPAPAVATSIDGPFALSTGAQLTVTVNGATVGPVLFPLTSSALNNKAFLVSDVVPYPVVLPNPAILCITLTRTTALAGYASQPDGTYARTLAVTITSGSRTFAQVMADIDTALGAEGHCVEYVQSGTGRLMLVGRGSATSISILPAYYDDLSTTLYSSTILEALGFTAGQVGLSGTTPSLIMVDALNLIASTLIQASVQGAGIAVETVAETPGTTLTLLTDTALGFNGVFKARSSSLRLLGDVLGAATDPVNPAPLVDVSDFIICPTGSATIANLSPTRLTLSTPLPTFFGAVSVTSSLLNTYQALESSVQRFISNLVASGYSAGLQNLDAAVAVLGGTSTPASRNAVTSILDDLRSYLSDLSSRLTDASTVLLNGSGTDEKEVVNGVVSSLQERNFDKALDTFLRCKIQEFLELDSDTSSYGGSVLKAVSDFAKTDVVFPNTETDDKAGFKASVNRG